MMLKPTSHIPRIFKNHLIPKPLNQRNLGSISKVHLHEQGVSKGIQEGQFQRKPSRI